MQPELIRITDYCINYNIEPDFIISLEESGIIILTLIDNDKFIHEEQFGELERYIHLHYDLHINIEGIDAIRHLLTRVNSMQQEIDRLKDQLRLQGA